MCLKWTSNMVNNRKVLMISLDKLVLLHSPVHGRGRGRGHSQGRGRGCAHGKGQGREQNDPPANPDELLGKNGKVTICINLFYKLKMFCLNIWAIICCDIHELWGTNFPIHFIPNHWHSILGVFTQPPSVTETLTTRYYSEPYRSCPWPEYGDSECCISTNHHTRDSEHHYEGGQQRQIVYMQNEILHTRKNLKHWIPVTVTELKALIGLLLIANGLTWDHWKSYGHLLVTDQFSVPQCCWTFW